MTCSVQPLQSVAGSSTWMARIASSALDRALSSSGSAKPRPSSSVPSSFVRLKKYRCIHFDVNKLYVYFMAKASDKVLSSAVEQLLRLADQGIGRNDWFV